MPVFPASLYQYEFYSSYKISLRFLLRSETIQSTRDLVAKIKRHKTPAGIARIPTMIKPIQVTSRPIHFDTECIGFPVLFCRLQSIILSIIRLFLTLSYFAQRIYSYSSLSSASLLRIKKINHFLYFPFHCPANNRIVCFRCDTVY